MLFYFILVYFLFYHTSNEIICALNGGGRAGDGVTCSWCVAFCVVQLLKRGSCGPRSTHTANLCAAIKNKAALCCEAQRFHAVYTVQHSSGTAPNPLPLPLPLKLSKVPKYPLTL